MANTAENWPRKSRPYNQNADTHNPAEQQGEKQSDQQQADDRGDELARLLLADFDRSVLRVFVQPFLLTAQIDGVVRRHVPDFLLLTPTGPVVVDVKPLDRLARPNVAFTISWTKWAMSLCGWDYEVFHEPSAIRLDNVRFLAGYRRAWLFDPSLLADLATAAGDECTFGEAIRVVNGWPEPLARAGLLHLIWTGRLVTDIDCPLTTDAVVSARVA